MTADAPGRSPGPVRGRGSSGLGTIYGKTVRDSRRAALVVGGVGGLFMIATGAPYGSRPSSRPPSCARQFVAG